MIYHGDEHKRKRTGGRKVPYRKKRKAHMGRYPINTILKERKTKKVRTKGGGLKVKLVSDNYVNAYDPDTRKVYRLKILRVVGNPASADLERRGIITKGALLETEMGIVRVTSRPGQVPLINGVIIEKPKT